MIKTIDIPEIAVREAQSRGIAVEELLRQKFEGPAGAYPEDPTPEAIEAWIESLPNFGPATKTPAEAAASMREMRKRYTLGGTVTVKQLIEEGRRY